MRLGDINWFLIGSTNEHAALKKDMSDVVSDLHNAGCIPEIRMADIVATFRKHGFEVVKAEK